MDNKPLDTKELELLDDFAIHIQQTLLTGWLNSPRMPIEKPLEESAYNLAHKMILERRKKLAEIKKNQPVPTIGEALSLSRHGGTIISAFKELSDQPFTDEEIRELPVTKLFQWPADDYFNHHGFGTRAEQLFNNLKEQYDQA